MKQVFIRIIDKHHFWNECEYHFECCKLLGKKDGLSWEKVYLVERKNGERLEVNYIYE